MGSSTRVASGVAGLANAFSTGGASEALARFDLQDFAGRPAIDVLEAFADRICPEGGTIDEAIARDAMLEALAAFAAEDLGDFEDLTTEQLGDFLREVITRSVVTKVVNDIGFGSRHSSATDRDYQAAQDTLRDYTSGAVRDAIGSHFELGQSITEAELERRVGEVYMSSFELLEIMLEED